MEQAQVIVVMVPIPSQSHLNQLLQLAILISSHGLPVHYVGTATHNRQVKLRAYGLKPNATAKIYFHDFPTPPIDSPDPNPNTYDKLPVHISPAVEAYMNLRQQVSAYVQDLASKAKRIVVIHDRLISQTVQDVYAIPNIEAYAMSCLPAFNLFFALWETMGKPFELEAELGNFPSVREFFKEEILSFITSTPECFKDRAGDIYNTNRLLEGPYLDLLAREEISGNKKQWAIVPSLPVKPSLSNSKHKCLQWLDKQAPKSVIFVSFGTTTALSEEEAKELAIGLEESTQKFIWVLRDADKADIFAGETRRIELPEGYEERVEGTGMVVREWAPQLEILAHESTGGFMSHCGWNSCLESIALGVPIAAWPMHSDQPLNAILVTEVLKVGLVAREWAHCKEMVKASTIKNVVQRLMASEEGNSVRKMAEQLGEKVRESLEEGGVSYREYESFVAHITR